MLRRFHLFILAAAALLPVLVFSALIIVLFDKQQEVSVEQRLRQVARSSLSSIDREITRQLTALEVLASSLSHSGDDFSTFGVQAMSVLADQPDWLMLELTDTASDRPLLELTQAGVVATSGAHAQGGGQGKDPLPRLGASGLMILQPGGFAVVRLQVPVVHDGIWRYTLGAAVKASVFSRVLREQGLPHDWIGAVLDQFHTIVGRTRAETTFVGTYATPSLRQELERASENFFFALTKEGERVYTAFRQSPVSGWTVAVGAPAAVVDEAFNRSLMAIGGGGSVALLLALLLTGTVSSSLTRRQQAERRLVAYEAMRDAEQRLTDIAAHFPGVLYRRVLQPDGLVFCTYVSESEASPIWLPPEDIRKPLPLRRHGELYLMPDDLDRWERAVRHSAQTLEPLNLVARFHSPDGTIRWTRSAAHTHRGPDGTIIWDGAIIDITDLKKAETALRESETRLRLALEAAALGEIEYDFKTDSAIRSPIVDQLFGYEPGSVGTDARNLRDRIHPDDRERVFEEMNHSKDGLTDWWSEFRVVWPDGSVHWVAARGEVRCDAHGEAERIVGVLMDITERKRSEAALVASEERFRRLAENSTFGLVIGHAEGRLTYANPTILSMLGYGRDEIESGSVWWTQLTPSRFADRDEQAGRQLREMGSCAPYEKAYITRQGREVPILFGAAVIDGAADTGPMVAGFVTDLTPLKSVEAALRQAKEQAEEANLAKSRFLAAASHDLRQPLNAMSLLLGALCHRVADPSALEIVTQIQASLEAMIKLFNGLLDISKLEAASMEVNYGPVESANLLQRLANDFAGDAADRGLKFRVVESSKVLWTDVVLLERILRNFLSNAIRHTDRGGILIGCRRRGDALRIDVCDTGPGIAESQREHIFEEFYQLGNPARNRIEGHGLGLAIVKRTAALLGHKVTIASRVGKGSRFSIEVPLADPSRITGLVPQNGPASPPHLPCGLVLVVEDDPIVAMAMRLTLQDMGCSLLFAASIDDAVRVASEAPCPPKLIIADYRLPGEGTGLDVIRAVRSALRRDIAACVITGDVSGEIDAEVRRLGGRRLLKPVKPQDLRALIDGCLSLDAQDMRHLGHVS